MSFDGGGKGRRRMMVRWAAHGGQGKPVYQNILNSLTNILDFNSNDLSFEMPYLIVFFYFKNN